MMISQNKHIIPLQDERFDLAFNISPLDTIKYNDSNFKTKVSDAISYAIKLSSEKKVSGTPPQGPEVFTFYNLKGFRLSDTNINFFKLVYEFGENLGFFLFDNKKSKTYKFIGAFDNADPKITILHTKILIDNITTAYEELMRGGTKTEEDKKLNFNYLINSISIDLIISPFFEKSEILQRIKSIADKKYKYPITIYYRNDFNNFIDDMYKEIGVVDPIKPKTT